jgi:hypothetical protein
MCAQARAAGRADAAGVCAAELARARRAARELVLTAQRDAYDELGRRTGDALRDPARIAVLRSALAARARAALGETAAIVDHPSGGVVGQVAGRRVDCSIDALVEHVLATRADRLAGLWSS